MKTIILGAAGLLLSGTALAGVVTSKSMDSAPTAAPVAAKDTETLSDSMIGNAITIDWPTKRADARAVDRKHIVTAAKAPVEAPAAETPSTIEMSDAAAPVADYEGVGGPDEPVTTAAAAPAASYRACSPGPGDDNCIQLYEPGVSEAYAAWQANSGMPGTEQTAMGGPEEPVEGAALVPAAANDYPPCRSRADDRCTQLGENETLAMGGPEEPVEAATAADSGDELAAYEPLPEDAVMPASADSVEKDSPDVMAL